MMTREARWESDGWERERERNNQCAKGSVESVESYAHFVSFCKVVTFRGKKNKFLLPTGKPGKTCSDMLHVSRHGSTALFLKVPAGVRTVRFERPVPGSSGFRLSAHCAASRGRVRRVRRVVSYRASISIKNTSFFSPAKANLMVSWRLVEIKWKSSGNQVEMMVKSTTSVKSWPI
jgi:hypothetical protein